jgi:PEP-CTERM motif
MKIIINGFIAFVAALLAPQMVQAQGTLTYVSNLGQSSVGSEAVGSDSWMAAGFLTGTNAGGYSLDSIQLALTDASGNPSGFTVMLYSDSSSTPGSSVATLNGSSDPATGGVFDYSPISSLMLSSGTFYFIVLTAGTTVANGAYGWSLVNGGNTSGGWVAWPVDTPPYNYQSSNGSSWDRISEVPFFQFAITATPVPEPGTLSLSVLGGLLITWRHWKRRTS